MTDAMRMVATVDAYVDAFARSDADAVVALFADDAIVEDPVGGSRLAGRDQFIPFFEGTVGSGAKITLDGPVRVGPDYAAFAFHVNLDWEGTPMRIDVIDVFRFNKECKVIHMQAFWGQDNFKPA